MKKNNKFLLAIMVLVIALAVLTACSKEEKSSSGQENGNNPETITNTPEPIKEAEATDTPEPTKEAEVTDTPEPTKEAEAAETPEPTKEAEPTETPEPTKEAEPTSTQKQEAEVTNNPEPTEILGPTSVPILPDNLDDNGDKQKSTDPNDPDNIDDDGGTTVKVTPAYEKCYDSFEPDIDEEAKTAAKEFLMAYLTYDEQKMAQVLAIDEEHANVVDEYKEYFEFMRETLGEAADKLKDMVNIEIIGGCRLPEDEIEDACENISEDISVRIEEVSDVHVFTASISTALSLTGASENTYGNVVVGKYKGEYKTLGALDAEEPEEKDPDNEEADTTGWTLEEIEEKKYKWRGNETAEEVVDIFLDAIENFQFIKMFSCCAMDEASWNEEIEQVALLDFECENYKSLLDENAIKIEKGEIEKVEVSEIDDLFDGKIKVEKEDVSDVSKISFHIDLDIFGTKDSIDSDLFVGMVNGEYRVLYVSDMIIF